jgi:hypothetical protein
MPLAPCVRDLFWQTPRKLLGQLTLPQIEDGFLSETLAGKMSIQIGLAIVLSELDYASHGSFGWGRADLSESLSLGLILSREALNLEQRRDQEATTQALDKLADGLPPCSTILQTKKTDKTIWKGTALLHH